VCVCVRSDILKDLCLCFVTASKATKELAKGVSAKNNCCCRLLSVGGSTGWVVFNWVARWHLPHCRNFEDIPFDGRVELGQIHAHLHDIGAVQLVNVPQIHLKVDAKWLVYRYLYTEIHGTPKVVADPKFCFRRKKQK